MQEEVKTIETKVQVRIAEPKVDIEPLVVVQVKTIETVVKETHV